MPAETMTTYRKYSPKALADATLSTVPRIMPWDSSNTLIKGPYMTRFTNDANVAPAVCANTYGRTLDHPNCEQGRNIANAIEIEGFKCAPEMCPVVEIARETAMIQTAAT
jgi:hypothetical protein